MPDLEKLAAVQARRRHAWIRSFSWFKLSRKGENALKAWCNQERVVRSEAKSFGSCQSCQNLARGIGVLSEPVSPKLHFLLHKYALVILISTCGSQVL